MPTFDLDSVPATLLSVNNPKTLKGEAAGWLTAILHLAPAKLSGRNVCPHATAGCAAACLNTAGRGGWKSEAGDRIQAARIRRTRYFQRDREAFLGQVAREIQELSARAEREGWKLAVRLNGTSDLPWERFPVTVKVGALAANAEHIFALFPDVTFYDYTKWPMDKRRVAGIENYHLTFSLSEHSQSEARAIQYLAAGHTVAVVFDATPKMGFKKVADPLPATYFDAPVIDGDDSDLRFLDAPGSVIGLRAKGPARKDTSGFVRSATVAPADTHSFAIVA